MNPILPPQYSKYIYNLSYLSAITSSYALYKGHYDLAICPGCVFVTSINYWRNPDYSWRRYLDMLVVTSSLTYQIVRAYPTKYATLYYTIVCYGIGFYSIGIWFYNRGSLWWSTVSHGMLHILGNLSNIILYSNL